MSQGIMVTTAPLISSLLSLHQSLFLFPWGPGFDFLFVFHLLLPPVTGLPLASATYFQSLARNGHSDWLTNIS